MSSNRRKIKRQKRRLDSNIYETPRYKRWRAKVFKRDRHICRLCGRSKCYVEAHHIKKKAAYPHLMFRINNGVALCRVCHKFVTSQEEKFVTAFNHMLKGSLSNKFLRNWRKNFANGQKRWMQKRGIFRHLRENHGELPRKSGIIKMGTKTTPKGFKKITIWKRKPHGKYPTR